MHMSYSPHTASHHAPAEPRRGGLELSTLVVAGVAAVVAAVVVSKIWAPGTMWATAFTPVIVSLVKEALERPAQRVSAVATRAAVPPKPLARAARTVVQPPPEAAAPPPPMSLDPALTERRVYGSRVGGIQRRWKLAVATGLIAFVGVVALFTLPELVAGRSVTSGGSHTTFFGGNGTAKHSSGAGDTTTTDDQHLDGEDLDDAGSEHPDADHDHAAGADDHHAGPDDLHAGTGQIATAPNTSARSGARAEHSLKVAPAQAERRALAKYSSALRVLVCWPPPGLMPRPARNAGDSARDLQGLRRRALRRELEDACAVGVQPQLDDHLAAEADGRALILSTKMGPRTRGRRARCPSGACSAKKARCSLEKSLRRDAAPVRDVATDVLGNPSAMPSRRSRPASRRPRPCASASRARPRGSSTA